MLRNTFYIYIYIYIYIMVPVNVVADMVIGKTYQWTFIPSPFGLTPGAGNQVVTGELKAIETLINGITQWTVAEEEGGQVVRIRIILSSQPTLISVIDPGTNHIMYHVGNIIGGMSRMKRRKSRRKKNNTSKRRIRRKTRRRY
jgi:hypothetical protein